MLMYVRWIQLLCFIAYTVSGYPRVHNYYTICKADDRLPWSYRGRNGPYHWGERFPTCNGREQSPVSIMTNWVVPDGKLDKLSMINYDVPITRGTIENNGETILVNATDGVERFIVVDDEVYTLSQFHFHWGDAYYVGSEHSIDNMHYAMEMHLVHRNSRNEIAVVAVLFQEHKRKGNVELHHLIDHFDRVTYRDMRTQLRSEIVLDHLLPSNPSSFYRYMGSLTTPECAEGVTWSVLSKPVFVGSDQMAHFRKLYSASKSEATKGCKLSNNFRPIQKLNGRKVFGSK